MSLDESKKQRVGIEDRVRVVNLVFGYMASQAVGAAVRLRVPDILGDEERDSASVAAEAKTQPQAMKRLLRALASLRVVTENAPDRFALAPSGTLLRTDSPTPLADMVEMFTDPAMLAAWAKLDGSVTTGEVAFDKVFGKDFFAHLQERPELSRQFNSAMSQGTQGVAALLPGAYDFGRHRRVMDIGGGDGTLLAAVLAQHTAPHGVILDTAEGLAQAPDVLAKAGLTDRCETVVGDFFTAIPEGADAHLIKSVLHDWPDDRCELILGHCRRALPQDGRLLIVEPVLPEVVNPDTAGPTYLSDLNMLVNVGGRERTRAEFEELCERAGFTVATITPLNPPNPFALIEAVPR